MKSIQTHYRILYGDVDQMGVLYYGNYLRLFERGRAEYIRELGLTYKEIEERGVLLPVTEAHCHYRESARYDDLVVIKTRLAEIRRASVRFNYEIFRSDDTAKPLSDGYTLHACLTKQGKIVRVPVWLLEVLNG